MKEKQFLVCDLETTSLIIEEAEIKVFGAYDPYDDAWFIYSWTDENIGKIMKLLDEYKIILTFNGVKYDLPILQRHGVPINTFRHIDIYQVYKKKGGLLRPGGFDSYSLKALTLQLKLDEVGKESIDYNVFKKETWTPEEKALIIKYLKQDLISTWKLWEHMITKLEPLKRHINERDAENYKHITTNLATYTYKVICNNASLQELYDEKPPTKEYPLTYMTTPRKQSATGRIVLLQFNHLITNTIIQFNLLSNKCKCCFGNEGKYHGRNTYIVKGYYCQRNQGRIEKYLKELYKESRTNNELKLISSIVFNSLYDVVTNGVYHTTYYGVMPNDCISLIKQQIHVLTNKFEEAGFYVLYIDNDDVFIELKPEQTNEQLIEVKDQIIKFLKTKMVYPNPEFDLTIKETLKYIQFVNKGSEKNTVFMYKGQYVYISDDGKVYSKGISNEEVTKMLSGGLT